MSLKQECKCVNLGFTMWTDELESAGRSTFLRTGQQFAFRLVCFIYLLALFIYSLVLYVKDDDTKFYFIYLTHITLILQVIYFFFATALTWRARRDAPLLDPYEVRARLKPGALALSVWFLQDVTYAGSFAVSVLFWAIVYDGTATAATYQVHSVNFLLTLVDCFLAAAPPTRVLHAWVPVAYGLLYVAWSAIHGALNITDGDGNDFIYSALDWNDPATAGAYTAVIALIVVPLMHVTLCGVRRAGAACARRCGRAPPPPVREHELPVKMDGAAAAQPPRRASRASAVTGV